MKSLRWVALVALVILSGCVDADPVAPPACVPMDSIQAGPYAASVCMTLW